MKSWFKNFLRVFSVAVNILTYHYDIQNKNNDDIYKTFHADGRCSLEEIVYFDESYKKIADASKYFTIISSHQDESLSDENEFYFIGKGKELNLSHYLLHFYKESKLKVESEGIISYIKVNPSNHNDYYLDIYLRDIKLQNGVFVVRDNGDNSLDVSSVKYEKLRAIPSRIFLLDNSNNIADYVYIKDRIKNPDFFLPKKTVYKDSVELEDLMSVVNSYLGRNGNYYEINDVDFVCTDLVSSIMYSCGVDLERAIRGKEKIPSFYETRSNIKYVNFFKNNKNLSETLHKNNDHREKLLSPEKFGLEKFSIGQVIIFNRYFLEGPLKNKIQRENIHIGVISEVSEDGCEIKKSIMVTGVGKRLENGKYENYGVVENDFERYYEKMQEYTSDETRFRLYYRIAIVQDMLNSMNKMKDLGYSFIQE